MHGSRAGQAAARRALERRTEAEREMGRVSSSLCLLSAGVWVARSGRGAGSGGELGYGKTSTGECELCPAGHGLGGRSMCQQCPVGTQSAGLVLLSATARRTTTDTVAAASVPRNRWPTLGCTDCLTVLPIEEGRVSQMPWWSRERSTWAEPVAIRASLPIALPGWYLEAHACYVGEGVGLSRRGNRTCFTRHACARSAWPGDYVRKEMTDLPEASSGLGNRTAWCLKMHEIALSEGVALMICLSITRTTSDGTDVTVSILFYQEEASCKEHYVKAISTRRGTMTTGVKNVCYVGHDPSSRACAACLPGMNKGDDRRCHRCDTESLWLLFRGDIFTLFAYQVPLTLFLKSGRPQALKSAMFASFMFFMQTVTLLGKDSGYFLGSGFAQQEGKQIYIDTVDAISRFMSTTMVASPTPVVENSTVTSLSVCPMSLDRHQLFVKNAVIRSLLLLFGCFVYNNVVYWLFVHLGLHYYAQLLLQKLSAGRLCADNHFEWNTEVRVMWQERVYDGPAPSWCQQLKGLFVKDPSRQKRYAPVYDKVAYGASAVLLDFHTCGTLFNELKSMEAAKEKVAQVQARAHFKLHDIDGDNLIQEQEMHNLLLQLGERPTPADVTAIMAKYGDCTSGSISENQFAAFWIERRRVAREEANLVAHSSCRFLCSPCRWCTDDLSESARWDGHGRNDHRRQ